MDSVLRSVAVYLFVLVVFRISGKRALSQITTFDFVLLLIIGEATQQALLGTDTSMINAWVVIGTLVTLDAVMSWLEIHCTVFRKILNGLPVVVVAHGKMLEAAGREGVTKNEILAEGREKAGLGRLKDFKYAILERHGGISVIPADKAR